MNKNTRRHKRFKVDAINIYGNMIFATNVNILDITDDTISLEVDTRLNIGSQCTIKLTGRDSSISLKGNVSRSSISEIRKSERGDTVPIYSVTVKFTNISDEKIEELRTFIARHTEELHAVEEVDKLSGLKFSIKQFYESSHKENLVNVIDSYRVKILSCSGMLVESGHALDIEDRFPMQISLPEEEPVKFMGRIAYCNVIENTDNSLFDIGIEFLEMAESDREKISDFVHSLAQ